jgi:hypothetical protein
MPAVMAPDFERRFCGLARLYGADGAARILAPTGPDDDA